MKRLGYGIVVALGLIGVLQFGEAVTQKALAAVTTSTYSAQYDRAVDPIFLKKIEQAIVTAAINIRAEGTAVAGWHKRSDLAVQVLLSPTTYAALFAKGAASNVAVNDASTDSDIQFTVNSMWSAYAGVGQ